MKNHIALAQDEKLYRRFTKLDGGKVSASDLSFPDISVNRASLSVACDLLITPHQDKGVCSFFVSEIPDPFQHPDTGKTYSFLGCEDPEVGNAAHAEVRAFEDGQYMAGKSPPNLIKTYFRNELWKVLQTEILPR